MLFLLKRNWTSALLALTLFTLVGLTLRHYLVSCPPWNPTTDNLWRGLAAFGGILVSDATLHGVLLGIFRDRYQTRHRALCELFRDQSWLAIFSGALMAGIGEELVFRGLSSDLRVLVPGAILFGLLHHVRRDLWIFTPWSIWQGFLLAAALWITGDLFVTMVAHFLHDVTGFAIFKVLNKRFSKLPLAP